MSERTAQEKVNDLCNAHGLFAPDIVAMADEQSEKLVKVLEYLDSQVRGLSGLMNQHRADLASMNEAMQYLSKERLAVQEIAGQFPEWTNILAKMASDMINSLMKYRKSEQPAQLQTSAETPVTPGSQGSSEAKAPECPHESLRQEFGALDPC